MTRRTIIPLAVMVALLTPASAAAKGISAAQVCGAQECVEVTDDELALLLAGGGPSVSGPKRGRPWYRTTLTVSAHDPNSLEPADRERVVEHFSLAAVPLARLLRGEDGTWMKMSHRSVGAYTKLTAGIRARPARTLTDVGAQAALPEARVDEVVEPPPATEPERAAGASTGWIAWLGGGLLAAGAAGLIVVLRGRVSRWYPRRSS